MTTVQKVLLVTGGSRGIGAAICRLGAKAGYRVAVNYASNKAAADALVAEIKAGGGDAVAVRGDVGKETDIVAMFGAVDRAFGRLDAFVNNAGIVDVK
ncbi:SDR family NAD(P)-dependent oxidoreductase, partial [Mesorhizobium sp. M8A.F.Ca.ET.023.01.1.1]